MLYFSLYLLLWEPGQHTHTHTRGAYGVSGFSKWHPLHSIEQRARQAPQSKHHVCVCVCVCGWRHLSQQMPEDSSQC